MELDVHLPGIVAGDASAFARWVAGSEPRLRASLASFAAQVDCEAVLQEALLRVWQVAPRHRPDGAENSLFRLAIRICRNLAIDELRRTRGVVAGAAALERALNEPDPVPSPPPDPLLRRAIQDCHDKLGGKPADALAARLHSGGVEPDELLAQRLGMRLNTFLQNVTRARKLLADCLKKQRIDLAELAP